MKVELKVMEAVGAVRQTSGSARLSEVTVSLAAQPDSLCHRAFPLPMLTDPQTTNQHTTLSLLIFYL